jgi:hypothetical protein
MVGSMITFRLGEAMTFRIHKSSQAGLYQLSGRFEAEHVSELKKLIDGESHVVLDLSEVKLVDRVAIDFLGDCEARGITLAKCPPYIREWISRLKNKT